MTGLRPLDVVLAGVPVGESLDPRYCIVAAVGPGTWVKVVPCSSQFDLYREGADLPFRREHPDFPATGFRKESYAIDGPVVEVEQSQVKRRYGRLEGEFAAAFLRWLV